MFLSEEKLRSLLVEPGFISEKDFDKVLLTSGKTGRDMLQSLIEAGLINESQVAQLLAQDLDVSYVSLKNTEIDDETFYSIPESMARAKQLIAFNSTDKDISIGMVDPRDLETINIITKHTGKQAKPFLITETDLKQVLSRYTNTIRDEFKKILEELQEEDLGQKKIDVLTVRIVDLLIIYAYRLEASDIHIEPREDIVLVRFRIDGVMHDMVEIPSLISEYLITRIKILAKLRTDEHFSAQDGKFKLAIDSESIDIRVSIVPVTTGENVVMRVLSTMSKSFSLNSLGFDESDLKIVRENADAPNGMILVSGPTGSGKTTTIYAVLQLLNSREVHVSTIEDPVEYDIEGVSQIQVNSETNLTFAEGLRAIVRQDPDIIMVGEIRDHETADIAVNSAMTGHLVLSTLHANDSVTTVLRLIEMGVEPFLVASTVNAVIAQRLVRQVCTSCRSSFLVKDEDSESEVSLLLERLRNVISKETYNKLTSSRLYRGEGCDVCSNTGYKGRIGIFEVLNVSEKIRELIMKRASADEIMEVAKSESMRTMFEDGVAKILLGVTTLEEVLRVVHE